MFTYRAHELQIANSSLADELRSLAAEHGFDRVIEAHALTLFCRPLDQLNEKQLTEIQDTLFAFIGHLDRQRDQRERFEGKVH